MPRSDPSQRKPASPALRYGLAVLIAGFAVALRHSLTPFLGEANPYHTAWVAVVFSVWYCGLGPSIVATSICLVGVNYWLLPQLRSPGAVDSAALWGMLGFLVLSAMIIALGEATRRAKAKQQRTEDALRESETRLHLALEDRTLEVEQKSEQIAEQARWMNLVNDAIFVRTPEDKISYWNQGAERLYGWTSAEVIGHAPQEVIRTVFPIPFSEISRNELWEGELLQTKRDGSRITVASRWTTLRNQQGQLAGWLEINTDITARKQAEDAARRLSGRILNLQDEERRRIARELHDSLGQYLTAAKINLDLLSARINGKRERELLSECAETISRCLTETRTLSHLLHPPLLDEAGFISAARWYAEGLAQRSGITVNLDFPPDLVRLEREIETALFRALQEALTNVYRHSGGSTVDVLLQLDAEQVRMEIKDDGKGMPEQRVQRVTKGGVGSGVGLAGMRERVREVGGSLALLSGSSGTRVIITIPLDRPADESSESEKDGSSSPGAFSMA
jgi:PAS domain S-box-containing protein